ncbi:hypothetical protein NW768_002839 [Fusarium equiseti]|uniref:HNH nuclease domain-containing protein n=1 Tax=Fusarium equiseti TaxID=61235 RepID=A0ABQ8RKF0_FUSEQ|nr:hypothetical protein NW768_002839 [Fusarium equiseti]
MADTSALPYSSTGLAHPVPSLNQFGHRVNKLFRLTMAVETLYPDFQFRVEQYALILLADLKHFEKGHALSVEMGPRGLRRNLERASPFCKHYMHHADPENLRGNEIWNHAADRLPTPQPSLTRERIHEKSWEAIERSMYYNQRFETNPNLGHVKRNKPQEKICFQRGGNACMLTGKTGDLTIFWFIPPTWNNNVKNNNITGNLHTLSWILANVDLLDDILSATKLGQTHQAWNMICVDRTMYRFLSTGWCAFKFQHATPRDDGMFEVFLQFYWMPQLTPRFNKPVGSFDMENMIREFKAFVQSDCPPPPHYPRGSPVPRSGAVIRLVMTQEEARKTESAVNVHWASIVYTALCGGAGRSQFLTGMDQSDGSLVPRDNEFQEERERLELEHRVAEMGWKKAYRATGSQGTESSRDTEM